jgi:hypothetical protein
MDTTEIRVGDTVVSRGGRGLRWKVTHVADGFVTAVRNKKGRTPITAVYRTEHWRKRS